MANKMWGAFQCCKNSLITKASNVDGENYPGSNTYKLRNEDGKVHLFYGTYSSTEPHTDYIAQNKNYLILGIKGNIDITTNFFTKNFSKNNLVKMSKNGVESYYVIQYTSTISNSPEQALIEYIRQLPAKDYDTLCKNLAGKDFSEGGTLVAIGTSSGGRSTAESCVVGIKHFPLIHRTEEGQSISVWNAAGTTAGTVTVSKRLNKISEFYWQSGYYANNYTAVEAPTTFLAYKFTDFQLKGNLDYVWGKYSEMSSTQKEGITIATLKHSSGIGYTDVPKTNQFYSKEMLEAAIEGQSPSDGSDGSDSGEEESDDPTPAPSKQKTIDYSGSSTAQPNYLTNISNYKVIFIPAKDARTENENNSDYFPSKTALKMQSFSGDLQNINQTSIKGYVTKSAKENVLYGIIPYDKISGKLNAEEVIEPLSPKIAETISSDEMAGILDKFLHYDFTNGNYIWSSDGSYYPGRVEEETSSAPLSDKDSNGKTRSKSFIKYHMPTMCGIISKISKNKLDEVKTAKEALLLLTSNSYKKDYISFKDYFNLSSEDRLKYNCYYFNLSLDTKEGKAENKIKIDFSENTSFLTFLETINTCLKYSMWVGFSASMSIEQERTELNIYDFKLLEAFTRGHDIIQDDFTTVRAKERDPNLKLETSKKMDFDDNYFVYKYAGREIDIYQNRADKDIYTLQDGSKCALIHEKDLLLETDVTLGDTYGEQKYFIQAIKYPELTIDEQNSNNSHPWVRTGKYKYKDTFKVTDFVKEVGNTKYVDEDLKIVTGYIDLLKCQYYDATQAKSSNGWCDCCYNSAEYDKECIYQKSGKCPYRFQTEKHPRRIRTLEQSKSNRFNLIQELSKVFEVYPQFYIEYDNNGRILLDESGRMKKHVFFMTEKGTEQYAGFRYEKNLSNISRTVDSNSLTTKMYVETVDSELMEGGICSISTAVDNIGKNNYILNFSYYTKKNLLNPEQTQRDIYGIEKEDFAFLPRIGEYNKKYDSYSNLIINMTNQEMTTLQASNEVAITGVSTALEERKKISQRMYQFKVTANSRQNSTVLKTLANSGTSSPVVDYTISETYISYLNKYKEQAMILWGLIEQLFFSENYFTYITIDSTGQYSYEIINLDDISSNTKYQIIKNYRNKLCRGELFWRLHIEGFKDLDEQSTYEPTFTSWDNFKEEILDLILYPTNGDFGQYHSLNNQVKYWKMERAKILSKINDLTEQFYKKYEPYIKEGTWTDSNYLTDNEYYWASEQVLSDSCKPKISYSINVVDISPLKEYEDDYKFELADVTYIEDIDFFGVSPITGLPNREKVILSEIVYSLDTPNENSITVQNYTTSFDELFEQITASVQSLTYNENTYKRASNFTAQQYIQSDSLQGTLSEGNLTLIDANENIVLDDSGTQGNAISNSSSQYRLTGEGLFFSTDGGETWDLGVGPQGFNMDYAKFGQLDASKVQIVDGEYIYFLWDKSGINAYRNPASSTTGLVDFARFNKYGLSLIENNQIRLRAGYEYKNNPNGENTSDDYTSELELTDQNIGFYLYNDKGKPIFKTETQSTYNDDTTDYSARLSLKGEMFVTNSNLLESNSGSVLTKVKGKKLVHGYAFTSFSYAKLSSSTLAKAILTTYSNSDSYFYINDTAISTSATVKPDAISNGHDTAITSSVATLTFYRVFFEEGNSTQEYYMLNNSSSLTHENISLTSYNYGMYTAKLTTSGSHLENITINHLDALVENSSIVINGITWDIELTQNTIRQNFIQKGSSYYIATVYNDGLLLTSDDENVSVVTSNRNLTTRQITYFDSNLREKTASLYAMNYIVDSINYSHWEDYIESGTIESGEETFVSTNEIGIFINNKISVNEDIVAIDEDFIEDGDFSAIAAARGERIFSIVLKGQNQQTQETVYQNLFTILKNGTLYLGGQVAGEYRESLRDLAGLDYMPDRISIIRPSFILANDGRMWMNWDKTFRIRNDGQIGDENDKSLWYYLKNGGSGGSSDDGSGDGGPTVTGYYLIDPIN